MDRDQIEKYRTFIGQNPLLDLLIAKSSTLKPKPKPKSRHTTRKRVYSSSSDSSDSSNTNSSDITDIKRKNKTKIVSSNNPAPSPLPSTKQKSIIISSDDSSPTSKSPHLDISSHTILSTPPFIAGTLRNYQIEGVNWLLQMHLLDINCVLADEMGLGKTLQTITFLAMLKETSNLKHAPGNCVTLLNTRKLNLLIVPKSTLMNWKNEISKFCPSYKAYILHCSKFDIKSEKDKILRMVRKNEKLIKSKKENCCDGYASNINTELDCIITTYEMCLTAKFLRSISFGYVVIDEAHRIKNENSKLSQFVRLYDVEHRLLITGTPLQNNVRELWALLNFLVPDIFCDGDIFEEWIVNKPEDEIENNDKEKIDDVHENKSNDKEKIGDDKQKIDNLYEKDNEEISNQQYKNDDKEKTDDVHGNKERIDNLHGNDNEEISNQQYKNDDKEKTDDINGNDNEEISNQQYKNDDKEKTDDINGNDNEEISNQQYKNDDLCVNNNEEIVNQQDKEDTIEESTNTDHNIKRRKKEVIEHPRDENILALRRMVMPFFLRREKNDVEITLKPKLIINLYPKLTEMQRYWYRIILKKEITGEVTKDRKALLNTICQLRKVCNHPYLFDGAEPEPFTTDEHIVTNSGKMVLLDALLKHVKKNGSRVLIFSQMSRMLDILEDYCIFREYGYRRLDGSTSTEERCKGIEEFNRDESIFVYLLTTRAGGLGINLTGADTVVIYDCDWNPQMDLQAMDRAHRIGQKKQVRVYKLILENTVEEKIIERCLYKLKLDETIMRKEKKSDAIGKKDLLSIISVGIEDTLTNSGKEKAGEMSIEQILEEGEKKTNQINEKVNGIELGETKNLDLYKWEGEDYAKRVKKLEEFIGINETQKRIKAQISKKKLYDFQFYDPRLENLLNEIGNEGEIEKMLKEGFDWNRKEFNMYLKACENVGTNIEDIIRYIFNEETGKMFEDDAKIDDDCNSNNKSNDEDNKNDKYNICKIIKEENTPWCQKEVRRYHEIFWERKDEIQDIEKIISNIEKGEVKRNKNKIIQDILQKKFGHRLKDRRDIFKWINSEVKIGGFNLYMASNRKTGSKSIENKELTDIETRFNNLKINYTNHTKSKFYKETVDKVLIFLFYQFGLENDPFLHVKNVIEYIDWCKFDYFIRTRSGVDLGKRINLLITSLLKQDEWERKMNSNALNL